MLRILVISVCIVSINVITATDRELSLDSWIEPDAWSIDHSKSKSQPNSDVVVSITPTKSECKLNQNVNDVISDVYYRKLLVLLFHKSKLLHDEASNSYKRTFAVKLSAADLKLLETSNDPRDLDEVATRIISNANSILESQTVYNFKNFAWQLFAFLNKSEVLFVLLVLLAAITIYIVHKSYNYKIITIIVLATLIFGYFYTYLECNEKLELDALLDKFDDANSNPCSTQKSFFNVWTTAPSKQKCFEHLKKKRTFYMYCRPDDVFIIYINELILKQFQFMVDKCMEVCEKYSKKLQFPYNYMAMIAIPFLLVLFLKEIFKNILNPRNWRSGYSHPSYEARTRENEFIAKSLENRDRLSGTNLKLLLNVLQNQPSSSDTKINSGVESLDCLTAPIQDTKFFESKTPIKDKKFFESKTPIKDKKFFESNESKSSSKSDLTDSSIEVIDN